MMYDLVTEMVLYATFAVMSLELFSTPFCYLIALGWATASAVKALYLREVLREEPKPRTRKKRPNTIYRYIIVISLIEILITFTLYLLHMNGVPVTEVIVALCLVIGLLVGLFLA